MQATRNNPQRIIDCFCFFNEHDLLRLRLQTLWDHVDIFVIVESDYTQSGLFKGQKCSKLILDSYASKIRYIRVKECPGGRTDLWLNENYQRNQILRGLTDLRDDDWLIISDLDEIPHPESIKRYKPSRFIRGDFQQQMFGYKLNNRLVEPKSQQNWPGSKITTGRHFRRFFNSNASSVRIWKSRGLLRSFKRWLFKRTSVQKLTPGGWHFSWAVPEDCWIDKFSAFAHQELAVKGNKSLVEMRHLVERGGDLMFPGRRYQRLPLSDPSLPIPLQKKPDEFRSILLGDDS